MSRCHDHLRRLVCATLAFLASCSDVDELVRGPDPSSSPGDAALDGTSNADSDSTDDDGAVIDTEADTLDDDADAIAPDAVGPDDGDAANGEDLSADDANDVEEADSKSQDSGDGDADASSEPLVDAEPADTDKSDVTADDALTDGGDEPIDGDLGDGDPSDADDTADAEADADPDPDADADAGAEADADADANTGDTDATDTADTKPVDPKVCPFGLKPEQLGCRQQGPCAQTVTVGCDGNSAVCDYSGFPGFELFETSCDGVDNDCNGKVDDELAKPAAKSWPDVGVCLYALQVCKGAAGWQEPTASEVKGYEPNETSCDGLDNDCDGKTDTVAAAPNNQGQGVCAGSPLTCKGGIWTSPDPKQIPGYEPNETSCDGLDNDCDGKTDEDLTPPGSLGFPLLNKGVCTGALPTCSNGKWQAPDYDVYTAGLPGAVTSSYEPVELTCDGLDNDCDGQIDNGLEGPPANKQVGICVGAKQVCNGAFGWAEPIYSLLPGFVTGPELVCDGLDNDCDGSTDEEATCPIWQRGGGGSGSVSQSADGSLVAVAGRSAISLLDGTSGAPLGHRFDHGAEIDAVALSPDGTRLASVGRDDVLRVVALSGPQSGKIVASQTSPGKRWRHLRWDIAGARLAIADELGWLRVFIVASNSQQLALFGHDVGISALDWQRAGPGANQAIFTGDSNGKLRRWTIADGSGATWTTSGAAVVDLAAAPTATVVLVARGNSNVTLHDAESGLVLASVASPGIAAIAFGGDNGAVLALSNGGLRRLLPMTGASDTLLVAATLPPPPSWLAGEVAGSLALATADGTMPADVVLGSRDGGALRRSWQAGDTPLGDPARGAVAAFATRLDLGLLVSAHADGRAWMRSAGDAAPWASLDGHGQPVVALALRSGAAPAGAQISPLLATGGKDGSARLWTVALPASGPIPAVGLPASAIVNVKTFGVGLGWPESLAFAPSGAWIWAGSVGSLRAVQAAGAALDLGVVKLVWGLSLPTSAAALDVAADGRVAVGYVAGTVAARVLDGTTGTLLAEVPGLPATRRALRFRPGSTQLALSGGSARLQLMQASDGALVATLLGHLSDVTALAWSADGKRLLSVDAGGSGRLWSVDANGTGKSLAVLTKHCPWPCTGVELGAAAFLDANGVEFVTGADDGGLIGWRRP